MKEKNLTKIICEAISAHGKIVPAILATIVALVVPSTIYIIVRNGNTDSGSSSPDNTIITYGDNLPSEPTSDSDSSSTFTNESTPNPTPSNGSDFGSTSTNESKPNSTPSSDPDSVSTSPNDPVPSSTEDATLVIVRFADNEGYIDISPIDVHCGEEYGNLPILKRDNHTFEGWYTSVSGDDQVTSSTIVKISTDHTLYAHWNPIAINVSLDANGGIVNPDSVVVYCGQKYGNLPMPQLDYYTFDGWYTELNGGDLVKSNITVESSAPRTLYAHWKQNDISGWVLSSEVPYGAEIVDQKWTYTKTETKESYSSSESGWTQVGSYWKLTDSGTNTYAKFSTNSDEREYYNTSDEYYKKYNVAEYTSYETSSEKREVSGGQVSSYIYYHWAYPLTGTHSENDRVVGEFKNEWINNGGYANIWESFEGGYVEYKPQKNAYEIRGYSTYSYWWLGRIPVYTQNYTDYIKMYQYKRELDLESTTKIVAGGDISNVQRYVKYRPQ